MEHEKEKNEVLSSEQTRSHTFTLSHSVLGIVPELEYLGVTLSETGISDSKMCKRIQSARAAVHQLRPLGVYARGLSHVKSIRLYKALIQTRWEYAMHLTPWTERSKQAVKEVEKIFMHQIFGPVARGRVERLKLLCRISSPQDRRRILTQKMLRRGIAREARDPSGEQSNQRELQCMSLDKDGMMQVENAQEAMAQIEGNMTTKELRITLIQEAGEKLEKSRKRKIPFEDPLRVPAILRFPRLRHRMQALKWACGRFPPMSTTELENRFGIKIPNHMRTLEENLKKTALSDEEMEATTNALDELSWSSVMLNQEIYGR